MLRGVSLIMAVCLLLSACQPKRGSLQQRVDDLYAPALGEAFELSGKMSFSNGEDGGSGRFSWVQDGDHLRAEFRAPLGQGSWQLNEWPDRALLTASGGEPRHAFGAAELIADEIGWPVPWQALRQWIQVRGSDAVAAQRAVDDDVLLVIDGGWRIEYSRFRDFDGVLLPTRVRASNAPYSIRLSVANWRITAAQ